MAKILHNPAQANHTKPQATIGGCYYNKGVGYRYFQQKAAAATVGAACVHQGAFGTVKLAAATADTAAGIAAAAIEQDNYGYYAVNGPYNMPVPDAAGAPKSPLAVDAGGVVAVATATTIVGSYVGAKMDEGVGPDGVALANFANVLLSIS